MPNLSEIVPNRTKYIGLMIFGPDGRSLAWLVYFFELQSHYVRLEILE